MSGKGSKRRPGKPGSFERGYEAIDWSKGRKPASPRKMDVGRVLFEDYATPAQWVIPSLSEILGGPAYGMPDETVRRAVEGGK